LSAIDLPPEAREKGYTSTPDCQDENRDARDAEVQRKTSCSLL